LKSSGLEKLATKDQVEKAVKDVPALQGALEGGGRFSKQRVQDFQQSYIEAHKADLVFSEVLEDGPLLGTKNVAGGVLPDFYLVPAIRDLSDETKTKGTSVFGRLLQRAVQEMTERDPRFATLRKEMQSLIAQLNARDKVEGQSPSQIALLESALAGELGFWDVSVSIEVTPPEIEKILELGTELHLDDGLKTLAERKGHGLQRAVIFALLRAWAKAVRPVADEGAEAPRKASECAYFAIEEPELFLHPHAQRQLAQALKDLAVSPEHQVFLCTHSTHFVDLDQYKSIAICYKRQPRSGTDVTQCTEDLFAGEDAKDRKNRFHMAAWVNPDRGELFFARKVILVEGETEKALLPYLAKVLGRFDPDVSVIDCGSKFNLALYIRILNAFKIPYLVIHDEDPLPDPIPADWSDDKRKGRVKAFHENKVIEGHVAPALGSIELLSPDFEGVSGISHNQADKKGKAIAALDTFSMADAKDIPVRLIEVVEKAYCG
jgi:CRISPR-associated exonuclease Cas4